jgi:transposase
MPSMTEHTVVIGVDTHKNTHTLAVVTAATGARTQSFSITADPAGYEQALTNVSSCPDRLWAIEGCGSWGRGLYRWLAARDEHVIEIERPKRPPRRMGIKDDATDALRCAREALTHPMHSQPRHDGDRDALAALQVIRRSAIDAAADAERQLQDLVTTIPEQLASKCRHLSTRTLVNTCAHWRPASITDPATRAIATSMRHLAQRIIELRSEAAGHEKAIIELINGWRPDMLEIFGVGPVVAAQLLCSWSHPGRIRNEAAFAMLAGTAPIPASSGQTIRHRLNRQGDRQLNRAIHVVVLARTLCDERTRTYIERRRKQGKTDREIRRCLKRYITRELFRALEHPLDRP